MLLFSPFQNLFRETNAKSTFNAHYCSLADEEWAMFVEYNLTFKIVPKQFACT